MKKSYVFPYSSNEMIILHLLSLLIHLTLVAAAVHGQRGSVGGYCFPGLEYCLNYPSKQLRGMAITFSLACLNQKLQHLVSPAELLTVYSQYWATVTLSSCGMFLLPQIKAIMG